jgi:putative spermidine/putrescine transport system ATP-binding protein
MTTIFVTHDQEEALSISDRIVVMHEGIADQIGTPFEIYNTPKTKFVASFVGTLNLLEATVVDPGLSRLSIDGHEVTATSPISAPVGAKCTVALRPESLLIGPAHSSDRNQMVGTAEEISFLGAVVRVRVRFGDHAVSIDTFNDPNTPPPLRGTHVAVTFRREDLLVLESSGANPSAGAATARRHEMA